MAAPTFAPPEHAEFEFSYEGRNGLARIDCVPNQDPASVGKPPHARGFPVCTATLEYGGKGYDAFFGWLQWVSSSDNSTRGRGFDLDPLGWFPDSRSPYCFFGHLPTLFDAPSRGSRKKMFWIAHSFLAATPIYNVLERVLRLRKVVPVLGFSWGFDIDDHRGFTFRPIRRIGLDEWTSQLSILRKAYPTWKFPIVAPF